MSAMKKKKHCASWVEHPDCLLGETVWACWFRPADSSVCQAEGSVRWAGGATCNPGGGCGWGGCGRCPEGRDQRHQWSSRCTVSRQEMAQAPYHTAEGSGIQIKQGDAQFCREGWMESQLRWRSFTPSLPTIHQLHEGAFEKRSARCRKSPGGVPVLRVVIFHKSVLSGGRYQRLPVWKLLPEVWCHWCTLTTQLQLSALGAAAVQPLG